MTVQIKVLSGGVDVRNVEQVLNNIAFTVVGPMVKKTTTRPPVSYRDRSSNSCYAQVAKYLLKFDPSLRGNYRILCFGYGFERNVYHAILATSDYGPIVNTWQSKGTFIRDDKGVIQAFCPTTHCVEEVEPEENYYKICDITLADFRKKYTKL